MPRRLVSIVRHAPGTPRGSEPSLEANAYAVTQDVHLPVVLAADAVRLAVAEGTVPARTIAGATFPASAPSHDLRALLESGIRVLAHDRALQGQGITPADLLEHVEVATDDEVADVMAAAEGVLTW